jgi:hypothetical protein
MSHATVLIVIPAKARAQQKQHYAWPPKGPAFAGRTLFNWAGAQPRIHAITWLPAIHRMIVPVIRPRPADQERHKGAYVLNIHQLLLGCSSATAHFVEVNDAAKHLAPLRIIRLRLPLPLASA